MKKYVVKREDVMIGTLKMVLPVKADSFVMNRVYSLEDYNGYVGVNLRGLLFNKENERAHDLKYITPSNYKLDGQELSLSDKPDFIVTDMLELKELLKCLHFGEDLTQGDVDKVFKMLLKHRNWLSKHYELFGIAPNLTGGFVYDKANALLPIEMYHKLDYISSFGYKPKIGEPGISYIKKRK